jgi:tetratricopeptide (TPR) repeat protein
VLLLEIALLREQAGDLRGALDTLLSAALEKPQREIFLIALTRFAREHGYTTELVEATELRAALIAGELAQQLAQPEPDQKLIELLRSRTVALWYEAARLRCSTLSDPRGAIDCLSKALETRPNDLLLRKTRMLAYDLLEDRKSAAEEAKVLLAQGAEGEDAAPLHFRLAEYALVNGDTAHARESLMEAIAMASGSPAADAILDDLLLDDQRQLDRIERRESRAASADPERAARWRSVCSSAPSSNCQDKWRPRAPPTLRRWARLTRRSRASPSSVCSRSSRSSRLSKQPCFITRSIRPRTTPPRGACSLLWSSHMRNVRCSHRLPARARHKRKTSRSCPWRTRPWPRSRRSTTSMSHTFARVRVPACGTGTWSAHVACSSAR